MRILAIDPGPERSAYVVYEGGALIDMGIEDNSFLWDVVALGSKQMIRGKEVHLVIEKVESYGMPVGRDVFETCFWIGRFDAERWAYLMPRKEVKMHLCGTMKAKDSNIRQALIDRYGGAGGRRKAVGLKAAPGPLYGVKKDIWSALALAVTYHDLHVSRET
jgi:hypothetical protein